jgi:DNA-binding GntR family transcriptional regulator
MDSLSNNTKKVMPKRKFQKEFDQPHSLTSKVFHILQDDIINGVYEVGESLVETKLSEQLGVSRTPIREAIRQLELEGLVHSLPNKGVFVKGISSQDIKDIYTIRTMVEGLAARWAAEKITVEELKELRDALELEEFYTRKNDINHLLELDSLFHELIFKASKSRPLIHVLSMFHHNVQRARTASLESPGRAKKTLDEHQAIFRAISEGNESESERLATEHVMNASFSLKETKKQKG